MKILRYSLAFVFAFTLLAPAQLGSTAVGQDPQVTALMRGYRTGYSDGYQAGVGDKGVNAPKEFRNKPEYDRADRAYNANWGALEEYRDGYRQGFEVGYGAGYNRQPFDSSIPANLRRRTEDNTVQYPIDQNKTPVDNTTNGPGTEPVNGLAIPRDSILLVELLNELSTEISQQGDPFQARVIDPKQLNGAILEGHIAQLKRPGKTKGTAQVQLAFDRIKFASGQTAKISGQVIEVIPNGGTQGVGKVDSEGGVQGQTSTKSDAGKIGGAAGIGAVFGAIFGGGSGAAIGAGIGAGVGTAGVLTSRGKDLRLTQGQQLRVRTSGDVEVQ
jgi:type IV secretion system protein VirB10